MSFTRNLINDLPQQLVDDMYDMLDRGVVQIDTEPQMLVYIYSFGKMHKAKLDCAFAHLPEDFLQQPEINIIDYGCGQAIGTMCYVDFLKEEGIIQNIRKVTLIEPSETCLKRAALHTSVFLPEAEITTVNKTFDELLMTDIETDKNIPTLHILSNVLDLKFNLDRFAVVINEHIKGYNQFVCVGPYFNYSNKDERISKFCSLINGKENFSKVYDKYELDADKPWTANIKLFSIGIISTESTEKDIKNRIIEALINDDNLPIYATKYDGVNCCYVDSKKIYFCEEEFETATKDDEIILITPFSDSNSYWLSFNIPTEATEEDIKNGIEDEFGVVYSKDGKRLLTCKEQKSGTYVIKKGTLVICDNAFNFLQNIEYCEDSGWNWIPLTEGFDNIIIPNSVTKIGHGAFEACLFEQITIPKYVLSIGDYAFCNCRYLKNINIPDFVTCIGDRAFSGCSSLKQINIPDSVTCIGDRAFSGCSSLKQILIPDSVTSIGKDAFSDCSSLKQIYIPDSVTSIGEGAFSGCSSLKQIYIPDSVTSIGNEAFSDCPSLKQIYIPDSVTSIGNEAFSDCPSLRQINIPNSVTSIGYSAFYCCSSLKQINIPDSVTSIGDSVFNLCENLTIKSNSTRFVVDKGLLIDVQRKTIISCVETNKIIRIPDSVTSIGEWAFSGCSSLQQINIPDSVTSIGDYAFSGCSSLKQIDVPDSVTSIGYSVFSDCLSLKQINIPANSIEKFKKTMDVWLWDILKEDDDERNLPF
jgi:hypothetical protein